LFSTILIKIMSEYPEDVSISINNIPADFPEEQLKALVGNFGSVKKWYFNAQFKFAKVAFASEVSQNNAISNLNGMKIG
jgi:RNA recognition motif-containing protein